MNELKEPDRSDRYHIYENDILITTTFLTRAYYRLLQENEQRHGVDTRDGSRLRYTREEGFVEI